MTKEVRVKLFSNSTEFRGEMSAVARQMKVVKSEFEMNRTSVENWGDEIKQSETKVQFLNKQMELQKQKVDALTNAHKDAARQVGEDAKETQNLEKRLNLAQAELNKMQNELTQTTDKLSKFGQEVQQQDNRLDRFGSRMKKLGSNMAGAGGAIGLSMGAGVAATSLALKNAVTVGMEFGKEVSRVGAISEASAEQIEQLKEQALELGASTTKSATEVAKGQEQLAASGFKVNETMAAMPGVISAAEASGEDMAEVSTVMASAIRGFGLEAGKSTHVADVFAMAANRSNASIVDMGMSFKYAAPIAKELGISVEELAAVTGILRDRGMAAEQVGTSMRMGLTRLVAPTDEAAEVMDELGIKISDAEGNMLPLKDVVKELQDETKDLTQEQKLNAFQTIFGTEAMTGFMNLVDAGPDELDSLSAALKDSTGASKAAADVMKDNLAGSVEEMNGAIETAKIQLTDALTPALKGATKFIRDITEKWNGLDEGTKEVVASTGLLTLGLMAGTAAIGTIAAAIGGLLLLTGPVGLGIIGVTAALGGLGIASYAGEKSLEVLRKKSEENREEALLYGEGVSKATQKAAGSYVNMREQAELQLFELNRSTGEAAEEMSSKVIHTYSNMTNEVVTELESFKTEVSTVLEQLFADTEGKFSKQQKKIEDEALKSIDKEIATIKKSLDGMKALREKYKGDLSKMSAEDKKTFSEYANTFAQMTSAFAKNQEEAIALQRSVISQSGKLSFDQAKEYRNQMNEIYQSGQKAAKKDYEYRKDIISKMEVDEGTRQALMAKNKADYNQSIAENSETYRKNMDALFKQMSQDGKLMDLESGKQFERLKKWDHYNKTWITESETVYQKRWAETQIKFLQDLGKSKEEAMKTTQQALVDFYTGMGLTQKEAELEAKKVVDSVDKELEKGTPEAKKTGADTGKAHNDGLANTKEQNRKTAADIENANNAELAKGKPQARQHGADKGLAHNSGLKSTQGQNTNTANTLGTLVQNILGLTDDGGGGRNAGSSLVSGLLSYLSPSYNAGDRVSSRAESGLRSHNSSGAGSDFVSGFVNSISAGSRWGSLWSAAWSVGKTALSALKKSIDSHSPSKETEKEGDNYVAGFVNAIRNSAGQAGKSAMELAKSANESLTNELDKMAFNIGGAANEIQIAKSELVVRNLVESPSLNLKFDQLLTLLEKLLMRNGNTEISANDQITQKAIELIVNLNGRELAREIHPDVTEFQERSRR